MSTIVIRLNLAPLQALRIAALQERFAQACNFLSAVVAQSRCWNRVALHHMTYKLLRDRYPELGSQMACNVIYSVCKAARQIYQDRNGQYYFEHFKDRPLPLIRFKKFGAVYFDRHTLSLKKNAVSLFTLDGRLKFDLGITDKIQEKFTNEKLREIVLTKDLTGYQLSFHFERYSVGTSSEEKEHSDQYAQFDVEVDAELSLEIGNQNDA